MEKEKVHFVYLGNKLPYYAKSSLILAIKHSGLDVHLLGNKSQQKQIKNLSICFTPLEDFYDQAKFYNASSSITSPAEYRDGFWLKTLERFFVLEQFMRYESTNKIFHAELDQVLFRADTLINKLDLIGKKGIFLPFHSKNVAIASILYCNDLKAMNSLVDFAITSGKYSNEMKLLASWVNQNPHIGHEVPSILDLVNSKIDQRNQNKIDVSETGGIADAAQIGTWVAGLDPRNVPVFEKPFNKFVDTSESQIATREQLSNVRLTFRSREGYLEARYENKSVHVFNLHIHSKIHNYINKFGVMRLIELANNETPISLWPVRYQQIKFAINFNLLKSIFNPIKIYKFIQQFRNH